MKAGAGSLGLLVPKLPIPGATFSFESDEFESREPIKLREVARIL